jgi:hypothetical protein
MCFLGLRSEMPPPDKILLLATKSNFILIRLSHGESYRNRFRNRACTKGQRCTAGPGELSFLYRPGATQDDRLGV